MSKGNIVIFHKLNNILVNIVMFNSWKILLDQQNFTTIEIGDRTENSVIAGMIDLGNCNIELIDYEHPAHSIEHSSQSIDNKEKIIEAAKSLIPEKRQGSF